MSFQQAEMALGFRAYWITLYTLYAKNMSPETLQTGPGNKWLFSECLKHSI